MKRAILTLLIPMPLVLMVLGFVFYLEYQKHLVAQQALGGVKLSPYEYAQMRYAKIVQKNAARAARKEFDVQGTLPPAPEGWEVQRYDVAHGIKITGEPFKASAVVKDTEKSIQDDFRSVRKYQKDAAAVSYTSGDDIVALRIRVLKAVDPVSLEGQIAQRMQAVAIAIGGPREPDPVFMVAAGIPIHVLPQISRHIISGNEKPVSYRRFEGKLGKYLSVFVFTNADDAAVEQVLQGIDYAALKSYANIVGTGAPVQGTNPVNVAAAPQVADGDEDPSWLNRLVDRFNSGGSSQKADAPKRMTCTVQNGYKRCFHEE